MGLLWISAQENAPRTEKAGMPSWSWLVFDDPVYWNGRYTTPEKYRTEAAFELCSADVSWRGRPMFSDLLKAELHLEGKLVPVVLDESPVMGESTYPLLPIKPTASPAGKKEVLGYAKLDSLKSSLEQPHQLWCFEVSASIKRKGPQPGTKYDHNVIVVTHAPGSNSNIYRMVG